MPAQSNIESMSIPHDAVKQPKTSGGGESKITLGLGIAAASGLLGLYAWISAVSPMNGEDYGLAMPLDVGASTPAFQWVWRRSLYQISAWNARFGEQLTIFWLAIGKPAFAVANTVAFAVFCAMVAWYARGAMVVDRVFCFDAVFASALTFLLWPRLETFFWQTAAAGYFQPLVLTLAVLLPFFLARAREWLASSYSACAAFAGAAWFAGASFENVPASVALAMVAATLAARRSAPACVPRLSIVSGSYLFGWIMLLLAPSTAHRWRFYEQAAGVVDSPHTALLLRLGRFAISLVETSASLVLVVIALVILARRLVQPTDARIPKQHVVLLLATIPSLAAVLFAPYVEPRAFAWLWIVLLIQAARAHHLSHDRYPGYGEAATLGLAVLAIVYGVWARGEYARFARDVARRDAFILSAKARGACARRVPISLITTSASPRVLNNRELWVAASLDQVSRYYGCPLVLR